MSERWLPVVGYEETYEVSETGQVRSRPRPRTKGGLLKQKTGKRGYPAVALVQGGSQKTFEVHKLVAAAFLGSRPEGYEVRHLDGDRSRPDAANLAYGTHGENQLDKRLHGTDHNVAKTHCPSGHPYDQANTYVSPSRPGARYCRACNSARSLARYRASRAA